MTLLKVKEGLTIVVHFFFSGLTSFAVHDTKFVSSSNLKVNVPNVKPLPVATRDLRCRQGHKQLHNLVLAFTDDTYGNLLKIAFY